MNIINTLFAIITYDENGNEVVMTQELPQGGSCEMMSATEAGIKAFIPFAKHKAKHLDKEFRIMEFAHRRALPIEYFEK